MPDAKCEVPPPGWECSRTPGHEGPCAASPVRHDYPVPGNYRDQAEDVSDLDGGELEQYARDCKAYASNLLGEIEELADDVKLARLQRDQVDTLLGKSIARGNAYRDTLTDTVEWMERNKVGSAHAQEIRRALKELG